MWQRRKQQKRGNKNKDNDDKNNKKGLTWRCQQLQNEDESDTNINDKDNKTKRYWRNCDLVSWPIPKANQENIILICPSKSKTNIDDNNDKDNKTALKKLKVCQLTSTKENNHGLVVKADGIWPRGRGFTLTPYTG
jgi:hypothetical protein